MWFLKKQISFSSNFVPHFSVMRHNSSILFSWIFFYFQQKEPIKVQIWWNFMRAVKSLHFHGLLWSKTYKVLDEKVQKSYVSWHWRVIPSLRKNWPLIPKKTWGIFWILMRAVASWKFALWCASFVEIILCLRQKNTDSYTTKQWCKVSGGTDLCFETWHEGFGKFRPNTWKSQYVDFNGSFWPNYTMFQLKNYGGVMCHDTERWCNFK